MLNPKKCYGCGAILQSDDVKSLGYVKDLNQDFCMDCFQLKHYGKVKAHYHPEQMPLIKPNSLVFIISSVLHLDMLFSYPVHRYQPVAQYVYVINQMDLLPKDTNLDYLLDQITKKAYQLKVPFEDIIFMSAYDNNDVIALKDYINQYRQKDVYLLGVQNSGKTTIYKALTNDLNALSMNKAGLTQETLSANYLDKTVYDMPGLHQNGYLHTFLPYETYQKLIPAKTIRPRIYQLQSKDALMIEGLIGVSFQGDSTSFVFYLKDQVDIEKTNATRIKERLKIKETQFKIFASAYEEKSFKIDSINKMQITFADMGFLHVSGKMTVKIIYPKGMHLSLTEAYFK